MVARPGSARTSITAASLSSIRLMIRMVTATVVTAAVLAGTAVGAVVSHPTPAGMARARGLLLRRGDFGRGWTS